MTSFSLGIFPDFIELLNYVESILDIKVILRKILLKNISLIFFFFFFFFLARRQILTFFLEQKEKKFRDETNKKYITIIIHFFVSENFQLKSFLKFLRKFFALLDDNFSSLKNSWVFFR